ncbi:MAG: FAD-dependent monooxygenase [Deltaproteobacteria bacterium]|nr:FAD-dependent monooxygenase [Deltaproteobacteria bacterium]
MSVNREKMVVVGSGLVGSLLATVLAKMGFEVDVFERRVDMRKESISAGRSINLAMSVRGVYALTRLGIQNEIMTKAIAMPGRIVHPIVGPTNFQRYGKDDSESIFSISRGELNKMLMTIAERTGKVKVHFQHKLTDVDFKTRTLVFLDEKTQTEKKITGSKVFGTDGSASILRHAFHKKFQYEQSESVLNYGYKELTISPTSSGQFQMEKHGLHIWPRGSFMLIALPNFDGSFTCTLFLPHQGALSFEQLNDSKKVEAFFKAQFNDVIPLIPDLTEQFFSNPTGQMVTVKSAPWNYGGDYVLLGDAAHAIVPFFGQGMNCGFEDVAVFWELLENEMSLNKDINWEKLFSRFSSLRKPNADAIADLAVENFVEMRDKVGDPKFLLAKEVEKILEKEFPEDYTSRYRLVSFRRVPYRVALEAGVLQDKILTELCSGIKKPEEVDLNKAKSLIQKELAQLLKSTRTT